MEPLKFVLSMMEAVAFLVVMVIVAIKILKANRPKPSCETCTHLLLKRRGYHDYLYQCEKYDNFNWPPRYCKYYCNLDSRHKDEQEDSDKSIDKTIVHCKDCIHWGGMYDDDECSLITKLAQPDIWLRTQPEDYCSSGQYKGGQDDV